MKLKFWLPLIVAVPAVVVAEERVTWVDKQHDKVSDQLDDWANGINDWLGETDPSKPAAASLRVMVDGQWNKYEKFTYKPRVRGNIKLPVLKKHLKVVFGDDELDNELSDKNRSGRVKHKANPNQRYNAKETRESNSSIGLRWSDYIKTLGVETDLDAGVRSGSDIYGRLRLSKTWQITDQFSTRLEQIYRYGTNSKHYLRTNFENKYSESNTTFIMNHTYFEYRHDIDESKIWGNSFYRQHNFKELSYLNYGLAMGGSFDKNMSRFNYWGPFIGYRQPIWNKWLFMQPEVNYFNNRDLKRSHFIGAFLRLEAIF